MADALVKVCRKRWLLCLVILLFYAGLRCADSRKPKDFRGKIRRPRIRFLMKCFEGTTLDFKCPCPSIINSCTFKKLPQNENIFINGTITLPSMYELDTLRTLIKIKNCHPDNRGFYVWECPSCLNETMFKVTFRRVTNDSLHCLIGSEVSFKCLCCATDLETCNFMKDPFDLFDDIVLDGKLLKKFNKYQFNKSITHIVLRDCTEDDKGTYGWECFGCSIDSYFQLTIDNENLKIPSDSPKGISMWKPSSAILLILAVILVEN